MRFPQAGETFQTKYKLLDVLGRGGFAAVYRATDIEIGRVVAIKILLPDEEGYDSAHVARFLREARVVAQLRDPHTITMFDFGRTDDGLLYMVFEYVAGEDLAHVLEARGPLPAETTIHVMEQVLHALREAHRAGVLHRDVKPANVLVYSYMEDEFRVKLLDFGIAKPGIGKHADPVATLTQAGGVLGTPRYMSPEQLCGEELGPTTDIYSLGLVVYEMLVGRPAIDGRDTRDNLVLQLSEEPLVLPPAAAVPAPLRAVVERMMARDDTARYQSVPEVLNALQVARESVPTGTGPQSGAIPPGAGYMAAHGQRASDAPRTTRRAQHVRPTPVLNQLPPVALLAIGGGLGVLVVAIGLALRDAGSDAPQPTIPSIPMPATPNPLGPKPDPRPKPAEEVVADAGVPEPADPCASTVAPKSGVTFEEATFGLSSRTWATYVPRNYRPGEQHTLVLLLHDKTRTPRRALSDTNFKNLAETHGFVVVAPEGSNYTFPWEMPADVEFISRVLERTRENLCIDPRVLYGVGHNVAAKALEELACHVQFSAIGTTAYRGPGRPFCRYEPPVPHIHFAGQDNRYAPIEGGRTCEQMTALPLKDKERMWHDLNGCTQPEKVELQLPTGKCRARPCEAPFVSCVIKGGRDWPGSAARGFQLPNCDVKPGEFPIAETMWKFFVDNGRSLDPERQ